MGGRTQEEGSALFGLDQSFPPPSLPRHLTEELPGFYCLVAAPEDTSLRSPAVVKQSLWDSREGRTALDILLKPRS